MDPLIIFGTSFLIGLSGALAPGPVTVVLTQHAFKYGFIASPLITIGHGILEILMVLLLAVGLGPALADEKTAGIVGMAGGIVLFWMGYDMVQGAVTGRISLDSEKNTQKNSTNSLNAGLIATITNPHWFLWWVTVGATYVTLSQEYGILGLTFFFTGHILADFAWLSFLALALVSGKRFITNRIYVYLLSTLGVFLLFFALYFFWSGFNFWI